MTESRRSLGVGIVGAGFMGQTYARTVSDHVQGAYVVAVADVDVSKTAPMAEEYGILACGTIEELLEIRGIDMVCVATPHALHGPQALAAAKAGKHLMIEKPMAGSVAECDAVLSVCKEKHLLSSIMYTQRARTGNVKTKELLASGRMGRVLQMRSYQMVPGGMEVVPKWQLQPEGVGLLFGHGIHNLDQTRWLTGAEIATVYAKARNIDPRYTVEGTSDVLLTMTDGTVCYIFCSFELPKPGFPRSEIGTRIICERGLIDIDSYGETRVSYEGGPWEVLVVQEKVDWAGKGFLDPARLKAYTANIQALVDAVREGKPLDTTGWDGRQAVAAVFAAYESSRTGREIKLN